MMNDASESGVLHERVDTVASELDHFHSGHCNVAGPKRPQNGKGRGCLTITAL